MKTLIKKLMDKNNAFLNSIMPKWWMESFGHTRWHLHFFYGVQIMLSLIVVSLTSIALTYLFAEIFDKPAIRDYAVYLDSLGEGWFIPLSAFIGLMAGLGWEWFHYKIMKREFDIFDVVFTILGTTSTALIVQPFINMI